MEIHRKILEWQAAHPTTLGLSGGSYGLSSLFCYLAPKRPVRSSRSLDERTREGDDQRNARAFHHYYAAVWKPYLISFMRSLGPRPHGERV